MTLPKSFKRSYMRDYDYTDERLIELLKEYCNEYGKIPSKTDIKKNPKYPSDNTYFKHFGTWTNALKLAGLDADTLIKKGILNCAYHKGRMFEIIVNKSFKKESSDLSGQNCNSPFDGICPKGYNYDAKSAKLKTHVTHGSKGWFFHFRNKQIEKIQYFILGGFDEDYTKLLHVWMIPLSFVNKRDTVYISQSTVNRFKQYEITDRCINLDKLIENTKDETKINKYQKTPMNYQVNQNDFYQMGRIEKTVIDGIVELVPKYERCQWVL